MELRLKGKIAVITGGSRGIGKGIARGLAAEGCRIVVVARGREALDETVKEISESGAKILGLSFDITLKQDVFQLRDKVLEKFGRIDILINNAGGNRRNLFENTTDQDWQDIIDLNLLSHIQVSRIFISQMKKQGSGSIIFISSI